MSTLKFKEVIEKYQVCPSCYGTPAIEVKNEVVFVECGCGVLLAVDHEGNELL